MFLGDESCCQVSDAGPHLTPVKFETVTEIEMPFEESKATEA